MVKNLENKEYFYSLNKNELQTYWEIKPLLNIFKDINFLEKVSESIDHKFLFNKDYEFYVVNVLKMINNYIFINNLKTDPEKTLKQLISALFLLSFNNKFIVDSENNNYLFINKYKLQNEISNNLKNFTIFFDENDLYSLNTLKMRRQKKLFINSILNILVSKNFVIQNNKTEKNEDGKIVTYSRFALNKETKNYNTENIDIRVYFSKLKVIRYSNNNYYKSNHYLGISEIYRPNPASNKFFKINEELNLLSSLNSMQYWLNRKMFDKILNMIIEEEKLENYSFNEIEEAIYKKYLNSLKSTSFSVRAQKESSKYYHILIFLYLKDYKILFEEPFYLSYYFDFRGRLYSDSIISPIGFKWFRYLYNYGKYMDYELKFFDNSNKEVINSCYKKIIDGTNIKLLYYNIDDSEVNKFVIVTCFFEIGKIFKSKYLKTYNNSISFETFIQIGINEYKNNWEKKLNIKHDLELIYIKNILESWNDKVFLKFIIYKDATASAIQLQTIIFESLDDKNYVYTNLVDDGHWHDTYTYIIEKFFEELEKKSLIENIITKINKKRLKNYQKKKSLNINKELKLIEFKNLNFNENEFNRSVLKKTIMTYNYSATIIRCYKNFLFELNREKFSPDLYLFDEFFIFYSFLEVIFNDGIFFKKTNQKKINNKLSDMFKESMFHLETPDYSTVFYDYYKKISIRDEKQINKKRFTTVFIEYTKEIDKSKTETAFKPNYIHSLDATLVRIILKLFKKSIITVHDCFGIDILNVNKLVKIAIIAANKINKENNIKINSNFILL